MYAARNSSAVRSIFEKHLMALILDLIPAERGSVILEDRHAGTQAVSEDLLARVRRERACLAEWHEGKYVLVAPLLVHSEVAGVIYLESSQPGMPADEPQSLLLGAIAQIASLALENAFHLEWLESEVKRLEGDLNIGQQLIGDSRKIMDLRAKINRVAMAESTVLITGESGTGKELVARALHQNSPRSKKPFVAINCAALAETLLESELFGHEKGSFTGAVAQKRGKLESAEGGTVFLDEIGEMPPTLQAKLLRVLQQREFERVGGTRTIPLDIRVIAATNRNLEEAVRVGGFRQDLFYRLNVVSLRTPALREHTEDILPMANRFAARIGERCGRRITGISPEARALLRGYDWPGNVRELENAMEHAVVFGSSGMILAEDLPEILRGEPAEGAAAASGMLHDAIHAAKRTVVQRAFEQARYDHGEAAKLLGVHPNYLYRLMRSLDVNPAARIRAS
jgi:Nif-specific regulatory protein